MVSYRSSKHGNVSLGVELGGRGEGKVYAVAGNNKQAAKIWKNPNPGEMDRKIKLMLERPPKPAGSGSVSLAWPEDALYGPDGKIAGYLMPRIVLSSFRDIFKYYNPDERRKLEQARGGAEYKRKDFLLIARNLSEAFRQIHQAGYVIGDVNGTNALADDQGKVAIIDCDSMQVPDPATGKTYLCRVGRAEFTPPRLQQQERYTTERTANDDCFGLASLIFMLLMQGVQPYQFSSATGGPTYNKIIPGRFPHQEQSVPDRQARENFDRFKGNWSRMEPNLRRCLREAFAPDYNSERPSAAEWVDELDFVINTPAGRNFRSAARQLADAQQERDHAKEHRKRKRSRRIEKVAKSIFFVATVAALLLIAAILSILFPGIAIAVALAGAPLLISTILLVMRRTALRRRRKRQPRPARR